MSSYFIAKSRSGSTAPSFGTRSRTWPYEARTVKSLPRYLLIVLALAGDSTMRRFLAMAALRGAGGPGLPSREGPRAARELREKPGHRSGDARGNVRGRADSLYLVSSRTDRACQARSVGWGVSGRRRSPP